MEVADHVLWHRMWETRDTDEEGRGPHAQQLAKLLAHRALHFGIVQIKQFFLEGAADKRAHQHPPFRRPTGVLHAGERASDDRAILYPRHDKAEAVQGV